MRSVLSGLMVVFSALQVEAQTTCREILFISQPGPFKIVRFKDGATPTMIPGEDSCLFLKDVDFSACKKRVPLDRSHTWYAGKIVGDWTCVTDAKSFGWTPISQLTLLAVPAVAPGKWVGYWTGPGSDMTIRLAKNGKTLNVTGDAAFQGGPAADVFLGQLDGDAVPVSNELHLGDIRCVYALWSDKGIPDECAGECAAVLVMINDRIVVEDSHSCGGINVKFDGIYDRGDPAHKLDMPRAER